MPALFRKPSTWFILLALWYATLFFLSSQPMLHPPGPKFAYQDKVAHATYFAIGGVILYIALKLARPQWKVTRICLLVILFCSCIGALDEFRQHFVPNRNGNDPGDWAADTLGGFIACVIAPQVLKLFRK